MNKTNQLGSGLIIGIVIAVLIIGGGIAAYALTDGFGTNKDTNTASSSNSKSNTKPDKDKKTLPDNFPSIIPLPSTSSFNTISGSGSVYVAGFNGGAPKEDIVAFYDKALTENGWTIDSQHGTGAYGASNGDIYANIRITKLSDTSSIITITTENN